MIYGIDVKEKLIYIFRKWFDFLFFHHDQFQLSVYLTNLLPLELNTHCIVEHAH